jgi:hypothetical protein
MVTIVATVEPLAGLVMVTTGGVVSATDVTLSEKVGLVDAAFLLSPLYEATTLCVPADSAPVEQEAAPLDSVAVHSAPPSTLMLTVPVGELPVTLAVNDTILPTGLGLSELVTAVEEDACEADVTWMLAPVEVADVTVTLMP